MARGSLKRNQKSFRMVRRYFSIFCTFLFLNYRIIEYLNLDFNSSLYLPDLLDSLLSAVTCRCSWPWWCCASRAHCLSSLLCKSMCIIVNHYIIHSTLCHFHNIFFVNGFIKLKIGVSLTNNILLFFRVQSFGIL